MADAIRDLIERRMLEDAMNHVRESGQFRTAQELAELFDLDLEDLQSRLKGWETRGEIFSINDESAGELFPVFALNRTDDICPVDAIGKVLFVFGNRFSKLTIASWFIALNSFLDDQSPKDLVGKDPEWVIEAARDSIDESAHG